MKEWIFAWLILLSPSLWADVPSYRETIEVELHDEDVRAGFSLEYVTSLYTLVGSPIKFCAARWDLDWLMVDQEYVDLQRVPKKIIDQVYIYNVELHLNAHYKWNIYSYHCDIGSVFPSGSQQFSFNTPTSPSWHKFLVPYGSTNEYAHTNSKQAKEFMAKFIVNKKERSFSSNHSKSSSERFLLKGQINAWPIRTWLAQKELNKVENDIAAGKYQQDMQSETIDDDFFDNMMSDETSSYESSFYDKDLKAAKNKLSRAKNKKYSLGKKHKSWHLQLSKNSCTQDAYQNYGQSNQLASRLMRSYLDCSKKNRKLVKYKDRDECGYKDENGKVVIRADYWICDSYSHGLGLVEHSPGSDRYSVFNAFGNKMFSVVADDIRGAYQGGLFIVKKDKYQYLYNRHGDVLYKTKHKLKYDREYGSIVEHWHTDVRYPRADCGWGTAKGRLHTQKVSANGEVSEYSSKRDEWRINLGTCLHFTRSKS